MSAALDGVSVLQYGQSTAVSFAGRMLADFGAAVTLAETPGGTLPEPPPEDPRVIDVLSQGKTKAPIDPSTADGESRFLRLLSSSTMVITSQPLAAVTGPLARHGLPPCPVVVSITPWGSGAEPVMATAGDLLQYHGGGLGSITPRYANNPEQPPLRLGFPIAEFIGGLNAAVSALAALNHWRETGELATVDVSGQQAIAYAMGMYSAFPSFEGRAVSRVSRPELAPYHFLPCKDGWIMVICPEQHQWNALVDLMGNPGWADSELFGSSAGRAENWDAIEPFLVEWLSTQRTDDVYRQAQARRIPLAPVSTMASVLASPQLLARRFFREAIVDGETIRVPGVPYATHPPLTVLEDEV